MGEKIDRLMKFFREFLRGLGSFEIEQTLHHEKLARQDLFLLLTFGDLLGIPILSPYYSLRLLPYILSAIAPWKTRILRERDLTEVKSL